MSQIANIVRRGGGGESFPSADIPNNVVSRATDVIPFTVGGNDWQGRMNFIENALGEWVFVWTEGVQHSDPSASTARFNIAFSDDEGDTFSDNNEDLEGNPVSGFPLTPQSPADFIGDAQLFKCPNGDLILICQERGTGTAAWNGTNVTQSQYRSTDNGKSWLYDLDFCEAIGLTTEEEKGQIQGNYENIVIGNTIYLACARYISEVADSRQYFVKSEDNAQTWEIVSEITSSGERTYAWTEVSLAWLGGTKILAIARTANVGGGEARMSNDMGQTWGTVVDIQAALGYTGVHQPRTMVFRDFLLLAGRDNKRFVGEPTTGLYNDRCSFWTIPIASVLDMSFSGMRRQYLDPYYTGASTTPLSQGDAGYVRFLPKADGSFVFFGYWGTHSAAKIYKYIVNRNGDDSNERYANNLFLPETITDDGVRFQMNRDNVSASSNPPANGGLVIASRIHNTLATSDYWLLPDGTNPEFTVDNNGLGWLIFVSGRVVSNGNLANLLFKASFSLGFWLWPDDGQPAAAQVLIWNNSTTSTTLAHGIQVNLNSTGTILFRYAVAGTSVTATTQNAVFPNGSTTPKFICATFTSGNLIRVYVDGVLQTLSTTPDMSVVNMANFNSTANVIIGQRNNTGVFDSSYTGKMREVICQPVVWSADNIANIMLN